MSVFVSQAVKHLYALAKRRNYQLPSRIFDPLLALRIQHVKTDEEVHAEMQRHLIEKKSIKRMSRKEKKVLFVKKMPFVPPPPPLDYAYKDGFDTPCLPIL
jgi:hypothetical protein